MVDHGTFALSERSLSVLSVYAELFGADGVLECWECTFLAQRQRAPAGKECANFGEVLDSLIVVVGRYIGNAMVFNLT